jgi:hypothetical protein
VFLKALSGSWQRSIANTGPQKEIQGIRKTIEVSISLLDDGCKIHTGIMKHKLTKYYICKIVE